MPAPTSTCSLSRARAATSAPRLLPLPPCPPRRSRSAGGPHRHRGRPRHHGGARPPGWDHRLSPDPWFAGQLASPSPSRRHRWRLPARRHLRALARLAGSGRQHRPGGHHPHPRSPGPGTLARPALPKSTAGPTPTLRPRNRRATSVARSRSSPLRNPDPGPSARPPLTAKRSPPPSAPSRTPRRPRTPPTHPSPTPTHRPAASLTRRHPARIFGRARGSVRRTRCAFPTSQSLASATRR